MCGRFSLSGDVDLYAEYFGAVAVEAESLAPSWNVAPTDPVYVVAERESERRLGVMRWGLVPHWAADARSPHINARLETVATAPAFRDSFARKRCLIPVDGFYEWEPGGQRRQPHWFFRADGYPAGLAGVWASRRDPSDGTWQRTCAIITTAASGAVARVHGRMPLALTEQVWDEWLDRGITDVDQVLASIEPIDDALWMDRPVSTRVNDVRNNGPELLDPPAQGRLL